MSPLRTIEEWTGHKQPPDPMKILRAIAIYAVLAACVIWTMVSCSFQISADGAKSFSIDGEQAAKAIKILADK